MFGFPGGFMQQASKAMAGWQQPAYDAMYKGMRNLSSSAPSVRSGGTSAQRGTQGTQQPQGPAHGFYAGSTEADLKGPAMAALSGAYDLSDPKFAAIRQYLPNGVQ